MIPFREDVRKFAHAMEYKLAKNDHKGGWEDIDIDVILEKLRLEVEELAESIVNGNDIDIILEAADVANFAMMAAHNARLRHENSRLDAGSVSKTVDNSDDEQGRVTGGALLPGHNPLQRNWEQSGPDPAIARSRDEGCDPARPGRNPDGGHSDSGED